MTFELDFVFITNPDEPAFRFVTDLGKIAISHQLSVFCQVRLGHKKLEKHKTEKTHAETLRRTEFNLVDPYLASAPLRLCVSA
jgi:hypothetical protein